MDNDNSKEESPFTKLPWQKEQTFYITAVINVLATPQNIQYSHKNAPHNKGWQKDSILDSPIMVFDKSQAL